MTTEPVPSSLTWAVVVPVVGLLIWIVKALVDRIAVGQDRLVETMNRVATGVERIPTAVADALRDRDHGRV